MTRRLGGGSPRPTGAAYIQRPKSRAPGWPPGPGQGSGSTSRDSRFHSSRVQQLMS